MNLSAKMIDRRTSTPKGNHSYGPFFLEYSLLAEYNLLQKQKMPGVYVIPSYTSPLCKYLCPIWSQTWVGLTWYTVFSSHFCYFLQDYLGRLWNTRNLSQPNPVYDLMGRPVKASFRSLPLFRQSCCRLVRSHLRAARSLPGWCLPVQDVHTR